MPREYSTITRVQNYLGITDSDYDTSKIGTYIQDMTTFIEEETNRVFDADDASSEKLYEAPADKTIDLGDYRKSKVSLEVDEFVPGTNTLTIDGTEISSDDYIFYPMNSTPKLRVVLTETSGLNFTTAEQNIIFKAHWGYSVVAPSSIVFACTILASGIILNSISQEGELKSITIGRYTATYKDEKQVNDFERVQEILQKYTRPTI